MNPLAGFDEIWTCDFEFHAPDGEQPTPLCMVARELRSGRLLRLWRDELLALRDPPFRIDARCLFVAYYASAELGCFLVLNWPMPARIVDLCVEHRWIHCGVGAPAGCSLLGALTAFGLSGIEGAEKEAMRGLAIRGGPFTEEEQRALVDYCQTDVDALAQLLPRMLPHLDLPRALLRGRYMAAAARMEHAGIPVDGDLWRRLPGHWDGIKAKLIAQIDEAFGVYEGTSFRAARFAEYLRAHDMAWPRLPSGALALDDDTFRAQTRRYPQIEPLHKLRTHLAGLRLSALTVGSDGRNRCLLSTFGSRTSRNTPSNSRFIFGMPSWTRGLIRPPAGRAIAYIDWEQQEFGIAAALSGDRAMQAAYLSGDPYLAFAKATGAVPPNATKESHREIRDQFKVVVLAVSYGMEPPSLAQALGTHEARARELLSLHRRTYPRLWEWSGAARDHSILRGEIRSTFGWRLRVAPGVNSRTLRNFPAQANGAELLRLACCLLTEAGIQVDAPVHDAVLIEAPEDEIEETVEQAQKLMAAASRTVLAGFELRSEAKVVRHPDRFVDPRGTAMWDTVMETLAELQTDEESGTGPPSGQNAAGGVEGAPQTAFQNAAGDTPALMLSSVLCLVSLDI